MRKPSKMAFDLNRNDCLFGTIVAVNHYGITIRLDVGGEGVTDMVFAFAHSSGKIGQRVLVSINYFNKTHNSFAVSIDSFLSESAVGLGKKLPPS